MSEDEPTEEYGQVQLLFLLPEELRDMWYIVLLSMVGLIILVNIIVATTTIVLGIMKKSAVPSKQFLKKIEEHGKEEDDERRKRFQKDKVKEGELKCSDDLKEFISDGASVPDVGTLAMEPDLEPTSTHSHDQQQTN